MSWTSATPSALAGLLAALQDSGSLISTTVFDGPQPTGASGYEAVTVGYTDEVTPNSVEGTLTDEGLVVSPLRERYTIQCAIWVLNGAANITAARMRAYDLLAIVGAILAADRTLGGTVPLARLAAVTLTQMQTGSGAVAQLVFGMEVDAYSRR